MPNATYLTVEEAAHKYGMKKRVLTQLIADGMVLAAKINGQQGPEQMDFGETKRGPEWAS